MKTLEEINKLREQKKEEINIRLNVGVGALGDPEQKHILVCGRTSGALLLILCM